MTTHKPLARKMIGKFIIRSTATFSAILLLAGAAHAQPSSSDRAARKPQRHSGAAPSHDQGPRPVLIKQDEELYTKGPYIAYAAPWSAKATKLVAGKDFVNTIAIHEASFPAQTKLAWHWPLDTSKKTGVRGYNTLSYGNYDGGVPEQAVKPLRVSDIRSGWQQFDWDYDLITGDFNLLAEFYLTRTPGAAKAKTVEVGFMLHVPDATRAWIGTNPPLATWRDAFGTDWTVTRNQGPGIDYMIFLPASGADLLKGRLDVKGALAELRRLGVITGDEWLNGVAFGAEPISGSGAVTVTDWKVYW
jgi:hypothetical protein